MKTPEERYLTDSTFAALVDQFYRMMQTHKTTPSEIRDAAMLALLRIERENPNLFGWVRDGGGVLPR